MTRYHLLIDITWALGVPRRELQRKLWCETGVHFSRWTLWRTLRRAQQHKFAWLPLCDAVDEHGLCKGHDDGHV